MRWLAILETMWDWRAMTSGAGYREAPPFFCINPDNFSGRRLYQWTEEEPGCLWCTNVCPELVSGPEHHGTPSVERLAANLQRWRSLRKLDGDSLDSRGRGWGYLCCGNVVQDTFDRLAEKPPGRILYVPHPAARTWTKATLEQVGRYIRDGRRSLRVRIGRDKQLEVCAL